MREGFGLRVPRFVSQIQGFGGLGSGFGVGFSLTQNPKHLGLGA